MTVLLDFPVCDVCSLFFFFFFCLKIGPVISVFMTQGHVIGQPSCFYFLNVAL